MSEEIQNTPAALALAVNRAVIEEILRPYLEEDAPDFTIEVGPFTIVFNGRVVFRLKTPLHLVWRTRAAAMVGVTEIMSKTPTPVVCTPIESTENKFFFVDLDPLSKLP